MTDRVFQKWFAMFRAGDFSLDNAPQLVGQVVVDTNQTVIVMPEQNIMKS